MQSYPCKTNISFPADPEEPSMPCTVFILTNLKTEIASSATGPKLEGPRAQDAMAEPYLVLKILGDLITADHKVLSESCESRNNHRYVIEVQDLATQWIQLYPCKTKTSQETQRSLQKFLEPDEETESHFHWQFLGIWQVLLGISWNHCTSTPHRSETNGIAEIAVHRVKEGTSAVLLQSGLGDELVGGFHGVLLLLRNSQDLLSDGKTPYERRFGMPFHGPVWSNGRMSPKFCKRPI